MYAEPGKGAIHGAKDLRHGDVYLRLGLTIFVTVSATIGRPWAFGLLALPLAAALVIYVWWLPKHGINGWTGEPKEKYYDLIDHKNEGWICPDSRGNKNGVTSG